MNSDRHSLVFLTRIVIYVQFLLSISFLHAQDSLVAPKKNLFWSKVQIGGGLGLGIGGNFTNITVAPSAIYPVNQYFSTGLGLQYSYIKQKGFYDSHIYGASLITLFNPIQEIQLSAELEELRVNNSYDYSLSKIKDNFWNTALFLGAGYRNQNLTIGFRYNILHKEQNNVYSQAWMPFVRVYF